jgi:nucleoside diphosphate kinase
MNIKRLDRKGNKILEKKQQKTKKERVKNFKGSARSRPQTATVMTWSAKAPHDRPIFVWARALFFFFFFPLVI